jgi:hypothetical protein
MDEQTNNSIDVEFLQEEKEYIVNRSLEEVVEERLANWLVSHHIVKTSKQGKTLLIFISILFFLVSALILFFTMEYKKSVELQKKMNQESVVIIYHG